MKLLPIALAIAAACAPLAAQEKGKPMVKKMTPVLLVDEVEPSIEFWVKRLGFEKTMDVPEGDKLGFAILQKGNVELMYQSFASIKKDDPNNAALRQRGPTFLYVEVESLDRTIAAVKGVEVVMPERKTFYGAREIGVKEPGGHIVTFAEFAAQPAASH